MEVRGVCPKPLTDAAPHKEYVGWLESLRLVQHYTNKGVGCSLTASLGQCPVVLASLRIFPLQRLNSRRWIFSWGD